MEQLLEIRDRILAVYAQYEQYLSRLIRFVVCLLALLGINGRVGYQESLTGPLPTVLIALVCALLSGNGAAALLAVIIVIHLFALSMEAALVGGCIFLLLLLVYFRFVPEDAMLLLLYPSCSAIGIPYVLPVAGGLLYGPASGVTVAVGVIADRFLRFVKNSETVLASSGTDTDDIISQFRYLLDGILDDRLMQVEVAAVIIGAVIVYVIRRRSIPYAWVIASAAGAVTQLVVLLIGAMLFDTDLVILTAFLGTLAAFPAGCVLSFMVFNLDYSRTENTQFEDDDYYYYVKAVPKNVYARPRRTVKTINTHRQAQDMGRRRGMAQRYYADDEQSWDTGSYDAVGTDRRASGEEDYEDGRPEGSWRGSSGGGDYDTGYDGDPLYGQDFYSDDSYNEY